MKTFAILFNILAGFGTLVAAIMVNQGALPPYNQWSDILLLLAGLLCFAMAFMLVREDEVTHRFNDHERLRKLDQKLWAAAHNEKHLRALDKQ